MIPEVWARARPTESNRRLPTFNILKRQLSLKLWIIRSWAKVVQKTARVGRSWDHLRRRLLTLHLRKASSWTLSRSRFETSSFGGKERVVFLLLRRRHFGKARISYDRVWVDQRCFKKAVSNYLVETLKNDIIGGHDVNHKIFGHRLDLKVKGSEELLV